MSWFSAVLFLWSVHMCLVAQSCLTVCNPMDYSLSRSSVHETFRVRILDLVAISCLRGSSQPGIEPDSVCPALAGGFFFFFFFFTNESPGNPALVYKFPQTV